MNPTETRLREAMQEHAARIHPSAALLATEYHPRQRRLRPPVAIGAAGLAGTAGAVAAIVSLTAGASTAFAGWSAKPTRPSAAQLAAAEAGCNAHTSLPLMLSDARGPFVFQIYADDEQSTVCTTGPSFQAASTAASTTPVSVPADKIEASIAQSANTNGQVYSFADGRVGSKVTAVALVLADGTDVTATVQNGWFVAWWPGSSKATSAELTTTDGQSTQKLHGAAAPVPPPGGSSSGSVSGSMSGGGSGGGRVRFGFAGQGSPQAGSGQQSLSSGHSSSATTNQSGGN